MKRVSMSVFDSMMHPRCFCAGDTVSNETCDALFSTSSSVETAAVAREAVHEWIRRSL